MSAQIRTRVGVVSAFLGRGVVGSPPDDRDQRHARRFSASRFSSSSSASGLVEGDRQGGHRAQRSRRPSAAATPLRPALHDREPRPHRDAATATRAAISRSMRGSTAARSTSWSTPAPRSIALRESSAARLGIIPRSSRLHRPRRRPPTAWARPRRCGSNRVEVNGITVRDVDAVVMPDERARDQPARHVVPVAGEMDARPRPAGAGAVGQPFRGVAIGASTTFPSAAV